MDKRELYEELIGLADSLDDHVTTENVASALNRLRRRVQEEGLEE